MTPPENRPPRRRRRRRRRAPGNSAGAPGSGNAATTASPQEDQASRPQPEGRARGNAPRKKRSRSRGGRSRESESIQDSSSQLDSGPTGELVPASGVLHIKPNGNGVLVNAGNNYVIQPGDPLVPRGTIEKLHLQPGLQLTGTARRTHNGLELIGLEQIEGMAVDDFRESRHPFSELISIDPNEMFKLETEPDRLTTRVLDLFAPLGKGQRCLIVAPPKTGKTTLLKDIAHGINVNHPDVILMVLLVDERPEEVTDFRRSVAQGEVIASSSDETAENHIMIAEVVLERARRLVEMKKDVVILCDSITRMSRAYNNEQRGSGKILSG
ncbi:MAG TPA: transcription termination factor Rho, partial [Thermoanaerobaculia bacterium]|nr:transcription termination factor Rho [Thermoanaerobaculia bacterium]